MKLPITLVGAGLALASCNDSPQAQITYSGGFAGKGEAAAQPTVKLNSQFANSLKYVDTDGAYFAVNDVRGEVGMYAKVADGYLGMMRGFNDDIPTELSFVKLIKQLKLDTFKSVLLSSKEIDGGWRNKAFYQGEGADDGVLSLLGSKGERWGALDYAPAGADLIAEFDLDLSQLPELLAPMKKQFGPQFAKEVEKFENQEVGPALKMKALLHGTHARVSIVAALDAKRQIDADGVKLPNADVVIRIDGVSWLWDKYADFLKEGEQEGAIKIEEKDDKTLITLLQVPPVGEGIPPLSPQMIIDHKSDQVWITPRSEFLKECRGKGPKLRDSAEFKKIQNDLSKNGSVFMYAGHEVFSQFKSIYDKQLKKKMLEGGLSKKPDAIKTLAQVEEFIFGKLLASKAGFGFSLEVNKNGLLMSSRSPVASKGGGGAMQQIMIVSSLSAISSPIILRQVKRSRVTTAINNMKDIWHGLNDFSDAYGELPSAVTAKKIFMKMADGSANSYLQQLFMSGIVADEKPFFVKGVPGSTEPDGDIGDGKVLEAGENSFAYVKGCGDLKKADANRPILITPLVKEGGVIKADRSAFANKATVLRADGSVIIFDIGLEGEIITPQGNLLSPKHPIWKGKGVDIAMPKLGN